MVVQAQTFRAEKVELETEGLLHTPAYDPHLQGRSERNGSILESNVSCQERAQDYGLRRNAAGDWRSATTFVSYRKEHASVFFLKPW